VSNRPTSDTKDPLSRVEGRIVSAITICHASLRHSYDLEGRIHASLLAKVEEKVHLPSGSHELHYVCVRT